MPEQTNGQTGRSTLLCCPKEHGLDNFLTPNYSLQDTPACLEENQPSLTHQQRRNPFPPNTPDPPWQLI